MSANLVKHWRRVARLQEQASAPEALRERPASERAIGEAQGFARALHWCADSLERSLRRARAKELARNAHSGEKP